MHPPVEELRKFFGTHWVNNAGTPIVMGNRTCFLAVFMAAAVILPRLFMSMQSDSDFRGTLSMPQSHLSKAQILAQAQPSVQTKWRRHARQQDTGLPFGPEVRAPARTSLTNTKVQCRTTTGPITIDVHHDWAPVGAERFIDMVRSGFFSTQVALFRAVKGFVAQTGISGDPEIHRVWVEKSPLLDDPNWLDMSIDKPMKRGYLSYAGSGTDTRGTQFIFMFRDYALGGSPWETPFATLSGEESFESMDHWYAGYGDLPAFGGDAPDLGKMYSEGMAYLQRDFPEMDYITGCSVVESKFHNHP